MTGTDCLNAVEEKEEPTSREFKYLNVHPDFGMTIQDGDLCFVQNETGLLVHVIDLVISNVDGEERISLGYEVIDWTAQKREVSQEEMQLFGNQIISWMVDNALVAASNIVG